MKIWLSSDYHLGHANIMKYCARLQFMTEKDKEKYLDLARKNDRENLKKFKLSKTSLKMMNNGIMAAHNSRVKPDDILIHVGDFCFKNSPGGKAGEGESEPSIYYEKRLNGKIIHIQGNHDKNNSTKTKIKSMQVDLGGHLLNLVHNPSDCNLEYPINIVGHVHNAWKFKRWYDENTGKFTDCINVGVDVWKFYPRHINEILKEYHQWKNIEDTKGGKR